MTIRQNTPERLDFITDPGRDIAYASIFVVGAAMFPFVAWVKGGGWDLVGLLMAMPFIVLWMMNGAAIRTHVVLDRPRGSAHVCLTHPLRRPVCREFALADVLRARVVIHIGHEADCKEPVHSLRGGEEWPIGRSVGPNFVADEMVNAINKWLRIGRPDFIAFD